MKIIQHIHSLMNQPKKIERSNMNTEVDKAMRLLEEVQEILAPMLMKEPDVPSVIEEEPVKEETKEPLHLLKKLSKKKLMKSFQLMTSLPLEQILSVLYVDLKFMTIAQTKLVDNIKPQLGTSLAPITQTVLEWCKASQEC